MIVPFVLSNGYFLNPVFKKRALFNLDIFEKQMLLPQTILPILICLLFYL